ncbi:hypothetical protein B296_00038655 [Ensete ventricosum]|uniref:Uncharacterized protein n=1 Tax=Ensete ventricosum TaxID=4639 RepID=A0A426XDT3_ENSVE|nr:hypothetical protein B296_00038655 [Ensete ventricosum]
MCDPLHIILPLENQDLSLLDICHVGATFLFAFFPLEVSETTIPVDYSVLLNNLWIVLPPQMRLLDCESSLIQPLLHLSRPSNMLNLLHTSVSYGRILSMPKRKFQCSMASSSGRLGIAVNTPSSAYKPLHEYQILRVSNSPHLCELCTTLSIVAEHIPLCTVSSFTKRPACLEYRQVWLPTPSHSSNSAIPTFMRYTCFLACLSSWCLSCKWLAIPLNTNQGCSLL